VLIEMKSRGESLEKHYDQTFDYWMHIVPKRPPFVILCNFDEFWIYDFNTQLFDPVDRIKLAELAENISSFNFLLPLWKKPIFGNNWVDVTRRAPDQMAESFKEIVGGGLRRRRPLRPTRTPGARIMTPSQNFSDNFMRHWIFAVGGKGNYENCGY
jgi:hypothetical protein